MWLTRTSYFSSTLFVVGTLISAKEANALRPPADPIRVTQLGFQGNGCTESNTSYLLATSGEFFSIFFGDFVVENSVPLTIQTKRCAVNLRLEQPAGWSFAVVAAQFRGYVELEGDTALKHRVGYRVKQGGSAAYEELASQTLLQNPNPFGNYQLNVEVPVEKIRWSSCTSTTSQLSLASSMGLRVGVDGYGFAAIDSLDGQTEGVAHEFDVEWRRCNQPDPVPFLGLCRARVTKPGVAFRQVLARGRGGSPREAKGIARRRLNAKATKLQERCNTRFGGGCQKALEGCRAVELRPQ